MVADIGQRIDDAADLAPGIVRHGKLVSALIVAGELVQGVADAVQARHDCDDLSDETTKTSALARALAASVVQSWSSNFANDSLDHARSLLRYVANDIVHGSLSIRTAEGFAFYAVYPEAYVVAARTFGLLGDRCGLLGLRSIGTTLAAVVAAAIGSPAYQTVRPVGDPFARVVRVSAGLGAALRGDGTTTHIIIDEGPGASGSSFAAAASALEQAGVRSDAIVFLPSHAGAPGAMASPKSQGRWRTTRRAVVTFDELSLGAERECHQLQTWFQDLVGAAIAPLKDLSAGAWRLERASAAPADPRFERRKFLLQTDQGCWLLKFAGLGASGERKWDMAQTLCAAGFGVEPIALRHGFILERWHGEASSPAGGRPVGDFVAHLGRYLGFRAHCFPADDRDGADAVTLDAMTGHNIREQLGATAGTHAPKASPHWGLRVRTDGRLHPWEWLVLPNGRLLKADALDHHAGHDLIGCQSIAWDIAGAAVEFDLSLDEVERLRCRVEQHGRTAIEPSAVTAHTLHYAAFQLGLWTGVAGASDHIVRYENHVRRQLCLL